jgi:hypothetical protein
MAIGPSDIDGFVEDDVELHAAALEEQIDSKMRAMDGLDPVTGDFKFMLSSKICQRNAVLQEMVVRYMAKGWAYVASFNNQPPDPAGYHLIFKRVVPDPLPLPEEPQFPIESC